MDVGAAISGFTTGGGSLTLGAGGVGVFTVAGVGVVGFAAGVAVS